MKKMDRKMWYFSFGVNHFPYNKNYVKLYGTCDETRDVMFKHFGKRWSMQYGSLDKWNPEKWGLTELKIDGLECENE